MNNYMSRCSFCGKEYDAYMRNYYIQLEDKEATKRECCPDCWHRFGVHSKYRFTNHIPAFCDGGDLVTVMFDDKDEIINYINKRYKNDNNIICMSEDGNIIEVSVNKKYWWVNGFSNLEEGDLPNWKDKVIELYGEL